MLKPPTRGGVPRSRGASLEAPSQSPSVDHKPHGGSEKPQGFGRTKPATPSQLDARPQRQGPHSRQIDLRVPPHPHGADTRLHQPRDRCRPRSTEGTAPPTLLGQHPRGAFAQAHHLQSQLADLRAGSWPSRLAALTAHRPPPPSPRNAKRPAPHSWEAGLRASPHLRRIAPSARPQKRQKASPTLVGSRPSRLAALTVHRPPPPGPETPKGRPHSRGKPAFGLAVPPRPGARGTSG
ncbi:hypothetical protein WA016_03679 [Myxococcus stipitatus]